MSVDTATRVQAEARYSGWHPVTSPGIGRLGLAGSLFGVTGLVVGFIAGTLLSPLVGVWWPG